MGEPFGWKKEDEEIEQRGGGPFSAEHHSPLMQDDNVELHDHDAQVSHEYLYST